MIKKELEKLVSSLVSETLGLSNTEVTLDHPVNDSFGDFTTNIALKASKELKQNPSALASKLIEAFYKSPELKVLGVEKIELAGPGFVNFYLSPKTLALETESILSQKENYGQSDVLKGKKVMVEFAHPNTHKQFHIGHLRNISLGESLVRLLEATGVEVIRANYQGDVGLHVAKALWGIKSLGLIEDSKPILERIKFLGEAYVLGNKAYEEDKKDEVVAINKKIYAKDQGILPLWEKTRAWSLEYFDWIYKRLGTHYDRLFFESEVAEPGTNIAKEALKKGILVLSEGAVIFDGTPHGIDKRVFLNSEGLPTYEAKELGLASIEFSEFGNLDRLIHVVGPEQQSFFKVTFKVEELLDPVKYGGKQYHYVYGFVQLKDGKMSSRKGNVVTAISVIEDAKSEVKKLVRAADLDAHQLEEISEKVAVGAVKYSMLRADAKNEIAFDLKESIALDGNSGPYLQYTYARAQSVLRKSSSRHPEAFVPKDLFSNFGKEELSLLRTLYRYPEVVEAAAAKYEPHLLANFLFDLAQKFNQFYNNVTILRGPEAIGQEAEGKSPVSFRLALTEATAQIIKNGLYLLGIEAPERM